MNPPLTTDVLAARERSGSNGNEQEAHPRAPAETADLTSRTTQTVVCFSSAFLLPGFDAPQPAGDYRVDIDEDLVDDVSRIAWRRVGAFIHLPAIGAAGSTQQMVPVNPADLDAALDKDHKP